MLLTPPHLVVALAMVVLVLEEKVFVGAVSGKGDSGGPQAGKAALESVPPGEGALVPPGLAAGLR